jgi:hypothetical protein
MQGRCVDDRTLEKCLVSAVADQPPSVVRGQCKPGMVCRANGDGATCQLVEECVDNTTECAGAHELRTCKAGHWVVTSCGAGQCKGTPGVGATCISQATGESYPIQGALQFEHPPVLSDRSGFDHDHPTRSPAYAVIAAAYDGDELLGSAYTGDPDGRFVIEATKPPTADTMVYFFPMFFNDDGTLQCAVAHPSSLNTSDLRSEQYWSWSAATNGASDIGTVVVREVDGSGALYIYELISYGLLQTLTSLPAIKPSNVLALWEPGQRFDCGNGTCYVPEGWGASVSYEGGQDLYRCAVVIAGTEETPQQWSASVILHEFGHYMMDVYSNAPHDGGRHSTVELERPTMAWSEGWASFYGQMTLQQPIYFDQQEGTAWWFDVANPQSRVPKPDPAAGMDQEMGELADAAMLWHLWDPAPDSSSDESWDQAKVDEALIWKAFTSQRMFGQDRGYRGVDLVDFLDSLRCEGISEQQVGNVTGHYGFPYDQAMQCAQ